MIAFAKSAFRLDDKLDANAKGTRLSPAELDRYITAFNFATAEGGEAWSIYGKTVYELLKAPATHNGPAGRWKICYCPPRPIRSLLM